MAMVLTFIDANILFRMFAVSPTRMERYRSKGTSGSKALDYAINVLLNVHKGSYSTSEVALLEACSVAAREAGREKAITLLKAVLEQEGFSILGNYIRSLRGGKALIGAQGNANCLRLRR